MNAPDKDVTISGLELENLMLRYQLTESRVMNLKQGIMFANEKLPGLMRELQELAAEIEKREPKAK